MFEVKLKALRHYSSLQINDEFFKKMAYSRDTDHTFQD